MAVAPLWHSERLGSYLNRAPRSAALVLSLKAELASVSDTEPLIRELLHRLISDQQLLRNIESRCDGTPRSLSHMGLSYLMNRTGVSIGKFLDCLFEMPHARQLLKKLLFVEGPPEGVRSVRQGETVQLRARLHDAFVIILRLQWKHCNNRGEAQLAVEGEDVLIQSFDLKKHSGEYECLVTSDKKAKLRFAIRLAKSSDILLEQPKQPEGPLWSEQDMTRSFKFALLVSCAEYQDEDIDNFGDDNGSIKRLESHLAELGYQCASLRDPTRVQLLCAVSRLRQVLIASQKWDASSSPQIFLLLDGHGCVDKGRSDCCGNVNPNLVEYFLPADARIKKRDNCLQPGRRMCECNNLIPIEENIIAPLSGALSTKGRMIAVVDVCRNLAAIEPLSGPQFRLTLAHNRIDRLYTASHNEFALAPLDGPSISVESLLSSFDEAKHNRELLVPRRLLDATARRIKERMHQGATANGLPRPKPECCIVYDESPLDSRVFISEPLARQAACRVMRAATWAQRQSKFALLFLIDNQTMLHQTNIEFEKLQALLHLHGFHVLLLRSCSVAKDVSTKLRNLIYKAKDCPMRLMLIDTRHSDDDEALKTSKDTLESVLHSENRGNRELVVYRYHELSSLTKLAEDSLLQKLPSRTAWSMAEACEPSSMEDGAMVAEEAGKLELQFN